MLKSITEDNMDYVLSDIDHIMSKRTKSDRVEFLRSIKPSDIEETPEEFKVFIAGLVEYTYMDAGFDVPKWVMSDKYAFSSIEDNSLYKLVKQYGGKNSLNGLHTELEKSIPAFKWRNMICTSIFDSY